MGLKDDIHEIFFKFHVDQLETCKGNKLEILLEKNYLHTKLTNLTSRT